MQDLSNELKESISYHRKKVSKINITMWTLIVIASVVYFVISSMLDNQINQLAQILNMAIERGIEPNGTNPTSLIDASNSNYLGTILLGMFAARLLVHFGELRFHLKEMSAQEQNLFSIMKVRAAQNEELSDTVRETLLRNSFTEKPENEPRLHLPSETIAKISDSVFSKIEKMVSSRST